MYVGVNGSIRLDIGQSPTDIRRGWVIRLHLRRGQRIVSAIVDGEKVPDVDQLHLQPLTSASPRKFFPLQGKGTRPAHGAGSVFEILMSSSARSRSLVASFTE